MNEYCIVVANKGFFGRMWDKIFWKEDKDATLIKVVKLIY